MRIKFIALCILLIIIFSIFLTNIKVFGLKDKPTVAVSIEPISFFIKEVAGDNVRIVVLVPETVEYHQIVLTPDIIENALNADLIIVTGHIAWEEDLLKITSEKRKASIDLLNDLRDKLLILSFPGTDDLNIHGYWLYPDNAVVIAQEIAEKLAEIDPKNKDIYMAGYENFKIKITKLRSLIFKVISDNNLINTNIIVSTPPEQYIAEALLLNTSIVLLRKGLESVSPETLDKARKGLINNVYPGILMSEMAKKLDVYRYVKQLSLETNKPIIKIKVTFLGDIKDYETMLIYNLISVCKLGSAELKSGSLHSSTEILYQIIIIVLIIINLILLLMIKRIKVD